MPNRRSFLEASVSAILAGIAGLGSAVGTPVPANTTDVHHHIYDSRFPPDPSATLRPPDATADDYRLLQKSLGITRHVAIQPSTYGIDNSCLLDALRRFGSNARGIAVVNPSVSTVELKKLDAAGVRGLRFNLVQAGATTPEMIAPLSKRMADFGWHIQVNASTEQILAGASRWSRLPVPVVFDHFGHAADAQSPVFRLLCALMQKNKAWTKLSGVETISKTGPPAYADGAAVAKQFMKEAPERLLWGTNWPHSTSAVKPNDRLLFNAFMEWAANDSLRETILVSNPQQLFGFR
jgi:predicted TIM-barrel fold metal-dependent hydrolase